MVRGGYRATVRPGEDGRYHGLMPDRIGLSSLTVEGGPRPIRLQDDDRRGDRAEGAWRQPAISSASPSRHPRRGASHGTGRRFGTRHALQGVS
jgi:hypothetical protein